MSRPAPCLTVLILTEDSSKQSHAVWEQLLKRACKLLVPSVGTHRIHFDPQGDQERAVMVANRWKERRGRQKQVALSRAIATRILEQDPPGFVAFHIDGDRRWSDRASSENIQKFEALIVPKVRALLEERLKPVEDAVLEQRMARLFLVAPLLQRRGLAVPEPRSAPPALPGSGAPAAGQLGGSPLPHRRAAQAERGALGRGPEERRAGDPVAPGRRLQRGGFVHSVRRCAAAVCGSARRAGGHSCEPCSGRSGAVRLSWPCPERVNVFMLRCSNGN